MIENIKEYQKEYRLKNKDKWNKYQKEKIKEYRLNNTNNINEKEKEYKEKNKDRIKKTKKYITIKIEKNY